jgi:hypothetical protein
LEEPFDPKIDALFGSPFGAVVIGFLRACAAIFACGRDFEFRRLADERPLDFVRERIIRPLMRSYLSMGLVEGLPGELHTQNFYYKLKKVRGGWLPTGEVMFKDNDGFRFDTELAIRQGRKMDSFAKFNDPFVWGKFSNALGLGAEGVPFLGSWYYKLIRNVNGFETLAGYMLRALTEIEPNARVTKDSMQLLFDRIAAEEAHRLTGIRLTEADLGFGANKGLNKVLSEWRTSLALATPSQQSENLRLQDLLRQEWSRLKGAGRVSPLRRSLSQQAYFLLHKLADGALVIEARTPRTTAASPDPVIGFALLESPSTVQGHEAHGRLARYAQPVRVFSTVQAGRSLNAVNSRQEPSRSASVQRRSVSAVPVGKRCEFIFKSVVGGQ